MVRPYTLFGSAYGCMPGEAIRQGVDLGMTLLLRNSLTHVSD